MADKPVVLTVWVELTEEDVRTMAEGLVPSAFEHPEVWSRIMTYLVTACRDNLDVLDQGPAAWGLSPFADIAVGRGYERRGVNPDGSLQIERIGGTDERGKRKRGRARSGQSKTKTPEPEASWPDCGTGSASD